MKSFLAIAALLAAVTVSACSDSDTVPQGDPAQYFRKDLRGYTVGPGIMIGKANSAYWPQQALAGYRETTDADLPSKISLVANVGDCKFERPRAGEVVANVHVGSSAMETPIFAFSRKDLGERTKTWIEAYKKLGDEAPVPSDATGDTLHAVDVVVTETTKPVYLVLQSEASNVLWNVQAAPGVKISHVAVLGSRSTGVANLDPSVPVEFMNQAVLHSCQVAPVRKPADYWLFVQHVKEDGSDYFKDSLEKNQQYYRDYSRWFADSFGMGSEIDVIGLDQASQVLVGPLPADREARVPFRPLQGAEVRVAQQDYVMASSKDAYRAKHQQLIRELAEKMAGGDLKSINKGS